MYPSGPLCVEPRIPSGPLSVDSRGYHSSPLSTPSQHEHKTKDLPQNEVKFESLSLSEPEYKKDSQNVNKFKRISQSKMSMTEALSGVLNVMISRLSDLEYPGSSSISPRSVNKTMTIGAFAASTLWSVKTAGKLRLRVH